MTRGCMGYVVCVRMIGRGRGGGIFVLGEEEREGKGEREGEGSGLQKKGAKKKRTKDVEVRKRTFFLQRTWKAEKRQMSILEFKLVQ